MKTLGEIFNIGSGVVSKRKEVPPGTDGINYKILTLKSLDNRGFIDDYLLEEFVSIDEIDDKYLTKKGDIVIRLSSPFTAACINDDQENIIVTSLFAILRPKNQNVYTKYICIYLNSDIMQKQYLKDASGSVLQMIKTSSLKDYKIKLLEMKYQKLAVEINDLMIRENILMEDLLENKKQYNRIVLNKILIGGLKDGN